MHVYECVSLCFRPINGISVVSVEVVYPLLQFVAAGAALYTQGEQVDVGVQRELIHGIYTAQIIQYKEQDGRPLGTGAVGLNTHKHTQSGVYSFICLSCYQHPHLSSLLSLCLIQRRNL